MAGPSPFKKTEIAPLSQRPVDLMLVLYLLMHIPSTLMMSVQALPGVGPYVPEVFKNMLATYLQMYKDPFLVDPPIWFQSFIVCEVFIQLPFSIFALHALINGHSWIKRAAIAYGAHVATTTLPTIATVFFEDFSGKGYGPQTWEDRIDLFTLYGPFFFIPLAICAKFMADDAQLYDTIQVDPLANKGIRGRKKNE
eukprot:Clim_evm50s88 gene=Clim_evmTU50s88